MPGTTATAVYAAGLAMLENDDEAVRQLVELAAGDTVDLRDARDLLRTLRADSDRLSRADLLIQRAITRVQQSRQICERSRLLRAEAASIRRSRGQ